MMVNLQNVYISLFNRYIYIQSTLFLLWGTMLIAFIILFFLYKNGKLLIGWKNVRKNIFNFIILYSCTILPIYYIAHKVKINSSFMFISQYIMIFYIIILQAVILFIFKYKNKITIINAFKNVFWCLLYILLIIDAVSGDYNFYEIYNILLVIAFMFVSICICCISIKKNNISKLINRKVVNYEPINELDDLFETRKWQQEKLLHIIKYKEAIKTICVSGDWGQGKTSLMNIVINKLIEDKYPIIRINSLDFNGINTLFKYFFEQLEQIISKANYYNGSQSEISNFVKAFANVTLDYNNMKISLDMKEEGSYISKKETLQTIITPILDAKRLVVIVDDIERCNPDIVVQLITFIKAISTFDKCVVIFISNYEKMLNIPNIDDDYMAKFINYREEILVVSYREILMKDNEQLRRIAINNKIKIDIVSELDSIFLIFDNEIIKLRNHYESLNEKHEKREMYFYMKQTIEMESEYLQRKLNNPRTIYKLYDNVENMIHLIKKYLSDRDINSASVTIFLRNIEIEKHIIFIALVHIIFPKEYERMRRISLYGYMKRINAINEYWDGNKTDDNNVSIDIIRRIYHEIELIDINSDYLQINALEFINMLIENPQNISQLVTTNTSIDDECLEFIKEERWEEITVPYVDVIQVILNRYAHNDLELGQVYIENAFKYYMKYDFEKNKNIDSCFDIFSYSSYLIRLMIPELHCLKLFNKVLNANPEYKILNKKDCKDTINHFSKIYVANTITNISSALIYNVKNINIFKLTNDELINLVWDEQDFDKMIIKYINELTDKSITSLDDAFAMIETKINETEHNLTQYNYSYEDVVQDIKVVKALVEEYKSLVKINNYVKNSDKEVYIGKIDDNTNINDTVKDYINYIENTSYLSYEEEIERLKNFTDELFDSSNNNRINETTIFYYNKLLSVYYKKVGGYIRKYRVKALKRLEEIQHNKEKGG